MADEYTYLGEDDAFHFAIERYLGEVVTVKLGKNKPIMARLIDAEVELNQPGISCGFVHFVDPNDSKKCLGWGGVDAIWDMVKEQCET